MGEKFLFSGLLTARRVIVFVLAAVLGVSAGSAMASSIGGVGGGMLSQLGVRQAEGKVLPRLEAGRKINGVVVDPGKLANMGLTGLKKNDAVTIEVVGSDQVRVSRAAAAPGGRAAPSLLLKQGAKGSFAPVR